MVVRVELAVRPPEPEHIDAETDDGHGYETEKDPDNDVHLFADPESPWRPGSKVDVVVFGPVSVGAVGADAAAC